MGGLTDADRQNLYDRDVAIVNAQADAKIAKLRAAFDAADAREQAVIDKLVAAKDAQLAKRLAGIKQEWDQRLRSVRPGLEYKIAVINEKYDGLGELAQLEYDNWFDHAAQDQSDKDLAQLKRLDAQIARIEKWRADEIASELEQFQRHNQRPRRP